MPLSKIQSDILRLLAAHRDPESYVAGAAALNRDAPRYSGDIDVFHSREERAASAAAGRRGLGSRRKGNRIHARGIDAEIRRNSNNPAAEWRALASAERIDPHVTMTKLRAALNEAETFVSRMPTENIGVLFLQAGEVVQPQPESLDSYQMHAGQLRGHWPSSPEITAAMLERYNKKPKGNEPKP